MGVCCVLTMLEARVCMEVCCVLAMPEASGRGILSDHRHLHIVSSTRLSVTGELYLWI